MSSQNPYEAPREVSDFDGFDQTVAEDRSLKWLLFSTIGRIPRRTYWGASIATGLVFYAIFFAVVMLFGGGMEEATATDEPSAVTAIAMLVLYIPMIWIQLAIAIKRWHDRDKSGWWVLIGIIPIVGPIWTLIELGCLRGTIGPNQYGHDPT